MRDCFIDLQTLQIFMGEKITSRAAGQPGCVFAGSDCTDQPFFRALHLRQFSLKPPFTEQKGKSGPCLSYAFQHQFHTQLEPPILTPHYCFPHPCSFHKFLIFSTFSALNSQFSHFLFSKDGTLCTVHVLNSNKLLKKKPYGKHPEFSYYV